MRSTIRTSKILKKLLKDDRQPKRPAVPRGNNSGAPDNPGNTRQARTARRTFVNSRTQACEVMPQIGPGQSTGEKLLTPRGPPLSKRISISEQVIIKETGVGFSKPWDQGRS